MSKINHLQIQDIILTKRGNVLLQDIKIGDEVLGKNDLQEYEFYEVTEVDTFEKKGSRHWMIVNEKYRFAFHQSIFINGKLSHARQIQVGNTLETVTGELLKVESARSVKDFTPKIKLRVEAKQSLLDKLLRRRKKSAHTYFINGILVHNASRYWVGGTGNWSSTTHWSTSSGGASGASVPTSSDDANFDASSGTGTCTVDATATCNNFIATNTSLLTITLSADLSVYGNFTLKTGMTWSGGYTYNLNFVATTTGKTITTNTSAISATVINFNGVGGYWTLQDNFSDGGGSSQLYVNAGTLDTNNKTVTVNLIGVQGGTLTLGTSTVNTPYWFSIYGTLNAQSSTIVMNNPTAFYGAGFTYHNVQITGSGEINFQGDNTFNNLSYVGSSAKKCGLLVNGDQIVNGTLTLTGNSLVNRLFYGVHGKSVVCKLTAAAVSLTNVDFFGIEALGAAAPFSGTSVGDGGGNVNITTVAPVTRYWVGNGGNWSDTAHWSATSGGSSGASVPLCSDTVIIDANSITLSAQTITGDMQNLGKTVNFTGVLHSPIFNCSTQDRRIFGSLTLVSGMSFTNNNDAWHFYCGANTILTTAGLDLHEVDIDALISTLSLGDNVTFTFGFIHYGGTFDANNKNVTINSFGFEGIFGSITKLGNGIWTIQNDNANFDNNPRNIIIAGNSTIKLTDTTGDGGAYFDGGGQSFNILTITGDDITLYAYVDTTFNTLNIDNAGQPNGVLFGTEGGSFIILSSFTTNGSAGNLAIIKSDSSGIPFILSIASGIVQVDYMSITDSTAQGGALWYAGSHSTNGGDNTGWTFADYHTGIITMDGLIFATETLVITMDGLINTAFYRLAGYEIPRPKRFVKTAIYTKQDKIMIDGTVKRDITGLKYQYSLIWDLISEEDVNIIMNEIVALNKAVSFSVQSQDLTIDETQVFATISDRQYQTQGGDYINTTQLDLIEVN